MKNTRKIGIIGHGSITASLTEKIKETEKNIVIVKDEVNSILEEGSKIYVPNNYHLLDSRTPSKTRLKKCEKGLHEFTENKILKEWSCQHCGIFMHNR